MRLPEIALAFTILFLGHPLSAQTLNWSGHTWIVRSDEGGPGPNTWSPENVTVDHEQRLHLFIRKHSAKWTCAEVYTDAPLGFGSYQFSVAGRPDLLDRNVVLGLFSYPQPGAGPDGTNELDIEFARWGNLSYPNGNYTAYPRKAGEPEASKTFALHLREGPSTHRYIWHPDGIRFDSFRGLSTDASDAICDWTTPEAFRSKVARKPMPVHINLWLFHGNAPSDGNPVEAIVSHFAYSPLAPRAK